ncbi:ribonuclease H-like domain-containing protein [Tanacetum coccineum]
MALPEDHLAKFYKMTDAKEMWEAIKSRFGGNDESKKMQKYILKQQFEGFSVSNSEGLHKGYDRFQSLLSQLEIHGAGVSTEDANQKFLRSLPSAWSQISLIMRTKPGVDSLSFDDLYNNLRVFEPDVKGSTASSSSTQNVAFVSENTSSTNEVSTAYGASSSSGHNPQREGSSSYTDELMYSFFANQSSGPQLDHEDLEQLDEFDLEEMDLKWQVAMISMRLKKFYKKTGRKLQFDAKEPVGFDKAKVECYNCHKTGHFARECRSKGNQDNNGRRPGKQEEPKALVTLDGEGVDWTSRLEDEFMKIDLDDKTDVLTYHKKLLAEAEKEKEELKAKVEKWHNSSKNLNILLTSQMSARDKAGLGYGNQMNKGVLSYENEVFESVFYSRSSDIEDSPVNDRYAEGMHAVPPPMTGIYIPSGPDVEIDESQFTYGPNNPNPVNLMLGAVTLILVNPILVKKHLHLCLNQLLMNPKYFSHLIRDYDFHKKRMAKQAELNKRMCKGKIPVNTVRASSTNNVNTARHNFNRQTTPTNAARKVNTVKPIVNNVRPKTVFHKTQSPIRRPFYRTTAPRTKFSNQKVNTAEVKAVSAVGGKRKTVVKPSAGCNWRIKRHYWNKVSKYNGGSNSRKCDVPHKALENKGIVDSGCSRHMTGNKAYLAEYQDYNGGPVAFGGSKGYITGKGKIKTRKVGL